MPKRENSIKENLELSEAVGAVPKPEPSHGAGKAAADISPSPDKKRPPSVSARNDSEERLRLILESTKDYAIFTLDVDRRVTSWNAGAEAVCGYDEAEIIGRSGDILFTPEDRKHGAPLEEISTAARTGRAADERWHLRKGGERFYASGVMAPLLDDEGKAKGFLKIMRDLTGHKLAESALRASERRLLALVESLPGCAVFVVDRELRFTLIAGEAIKHFGVEAGDAIGRAVSADFPADNAADYRACLRAALAGESFEREYLIDGRTFISRGVPLVSAGGRTESVLALFYDISERRQAHEAEREKEAMRRLIDAQEGERRRIARNIHDHLGQQLTVMRLKLDHLLRMTDDKAAREHLLELRNLAKQLDDDIDFLAWELRPPALDDFGLSVALANFVREWKHHTKINAEFHAVGFSRSRLSPATETNLYRIAQEAINNIQKHSGARNVSVLLERRGGLVSLIIEDDGVGFDYQSVMRKRRKGLGLTGMRERAAMIGGDLQIESTGGAGTMLYVRVPGKTT